MSAKRPTNITVKRLKGDTYAEKFSVTPWPDGITAASLEVEGLGTSVGVLDAASKTLEFPVGSGIADGLGSAGGTAYDYEVVVTAGGATRTIVEGSWLIIDRAVAP